MDFMYNNNTGFKTLKVEMEKNIKQFSRFVHPVHKSIIIFPVSEYGSAFLQQVCALQPHSTIRQRKYQKIKGNEVLSPTYIW